MTMIVRNDLLYIRKYFYEKIYKSELEIDFVEPKKILSDSVKKSILKGNSDSNIICGPRGAGKIALVRDVINEANEDHQEKFRLFVLDGEVLAADINNIKSKSKWFCNSQSLLCRYNCLTNISSSIEPPIHFSEKVLHLIAENASDELPVIIVIFKFDSFCVASNQSLLYSLFDLTQMSPTPTCMLATARRCELSESFEKRVKSRFSHKVVSVVPEQDVSVHMKIVKSLLQFPGRTKGIRLKKEFMKRWNDEVEKMLNSAAVKKHFQDLLQVSLSHVPMRKILRAILDKISLSEPYPTKQLVLKVFSSFNMDPVVSSISMFSALPIALMICAILHCESTGLDVMRIADILEIFRRKIRATSFMSTPEASIMSAISEIKGMGFLYEVGTNSGNYQFMVSREQMEEGLNHVENFPTALSQWINRGHS